MPQTRVLVLVGSLRAASINRQLAETAAAAAPEGVEVAIYEGLAEVPFYNEDLDAAGAPAAAEALRTAAGEADALLLVTPEYNGTIPAVLKNAIDWISRPYGVGAVKDKPVAVVSASPSPNAAAWAHEDTRKAVRIAGGSVVEDASISIGATGEKFGGKHPSESVEVAAQVAAVVAGLSAAAGELVNA